MQAVKRYISGVDKNGLSKIIQSDSIEPEAPYTQYPSLQLNNLFYSEESPQSVSTRHDPSPYSINLPAGALRVMTMRLPTQQEIIDDLTANNEPVPEDWTQFNRHRTDSVDCIYILSGEISYLSGEDRVELKAGDFLAQITPEHTWINEHDTPCIVLCIMTGTKPSGDAVSMIIE